MRRHPLFSAAAAAVLLLPALLACAEDAPPEAPSFAWAAVKMVFSLALVLGILLVASRWAKKYLEGFSRPGTAGDKTLGVAEVRRLGPKTQVVVLTAFGAKYLLGLSPGGISVIDKIRDDETGRTP